MRVLPRLCFITNHTDEYLLVTSVKEACEGGVRFVQLRLKNIDEEEWEKRALSVQQICKKYEAVFIINDNVILAKKISADGVHLGKNDMPPDEASEILGNEFIIGATANTATDVEELLKKKIDYIGLGPFRFTQTKEKLSPVIQSDQLSKIIEIQNSIPVFLIGGILPEDLPFIRKSGAYGVAVSGAINSATEISAAAKNFAGIINDLW